MRSPAYKAPTPSAGESLPEIRQALSRRLEGAGQHVQGFQEPRPACARRLLGRRAGEGAGMVRQAARRHCAGKPGAMPPTRPACSATTTPIRSSPFIQVRRKRRTRSTAPASGASTAPTTISPSSGANRFAQIEVAVPAGEHWLKDMVCQARRRRTAITRSSSRTTTSIAARSIRQRGSTRRRARFSPSSSPMPRPGLRASSSVRSPRAARRRRRYRSRSQPSWRRCRCRRNGSRRSSRTPRTARSCSICTTSCRRRGASRLLCPRMTARSVTSTRRRSPLGAP